MEWFERDFDHPLYFDIYNNKTLEAEDEGPALTAMLDLPGDSIVLDVPCGWGRLRPYLEKRGWFVVGGDLSPLNLARHRAEFGGSVVRLDFRTLPFRDCCADGVLCAYTSWGYLATEEENRRQLTEYARVLRPGGRLLLDQVGRNYLENAVEAVENTWFEVDGYRERVRWSQDRRRVLTDRIMNGERFRHDIWIPTDAEIRTFLGEVGFQVEKSWGGLHQEPWEPMAERWIYLAVKG
jgi:SAM-dependent methyltransferase